MLSKSPDQLPAVLFVDDEAKTCKHFTRLFSPRFRVLTACDGIAAMEIFQNQPDDIGIIMTDQRMPNETGTEFLEKAARLRPNVKRILSTAYADVDAAVDAVNNSGIYRYITKPWEVSELEMTLIRAMELYLLEREQESLLQRKVCELGRLATLERIHGFAALAVFKENGLRNVANAIGSLVQFANPGQSEIKPDQWGLIYDANRKFLDLAHASLPTKLTHDMTLDHNETINIGDLFTHLAPIHPRLTILRSESACPLFPGPPDTLSALLNHLIQSLGEILGDREEMTLRETSDGITLGLPASSIEQVLRPLFTSLPSEDSELVPSLPLAAALFNWHHHGGQISFGRKGETLFASLTINPPDDSADPWKNLAVDLIGNASFWKRQI